MQAIEQVTPRVLTVKQAAQYIGMSQWFIRELVYGRKVPYINVGKKIMFDRSDLDTYLDERKVPAR
jgi:excisionase family DNA binding protein